VRHVCQQRVDELLVRGVRDLSVPVGLIFMYSGMVCMFVCACMNHLVARFGHKVNPQLGFEVAIHPTDDVSFSMNRVEFFNEDKHYYKEEALSFSFDMIADLSNLFNWNTNMVFLSLVCEFGDHADKQRVTVWD